MAPPVKLVDEARGGRTAFCGGVVDSNGSVVFSDGRTAPKHGHEEKRQQHWPAHRPLCRTSGGGRRCGREPMPFRRHLVDSSSRLLSTNARTKMPTDGFVASAPTAQGSEKPSLKGRPSQSRLGTMSKASTTGLCRAKSASNSNPKNPLRSLPNGANRSFAA